VDLALWTTFGPSSMFQQFPIIYLTVIPVLVIAVTLLWSKLPKTE
jgi:hypothetical protein